MPEHHRRRRFGLAVLLSILTALAVVAVAQQTPAQFGGAYSGLGQRRQHLVDDWVTRFNQVTGLKVEPGPFYDDYIKFSRKTTFDAVTHALMTTPLTDASGQALGDALGTKTSLEGTTVGVRLTTSGLKVVTQPNHAQFVVYAVPDDIAAQFDCASRLTPGQSKKPARVYGNYFGAAFYVAG
jgi:hypothetical protein